MLCYVTQYINIIHILLLVTFMDIFHGHIFLGYYFLMVIQRRMDQSMKRGMEQSNAMGWMVEKPWMTLLVGFIYIYILDIQRYPLKKKTETKKAASLQHAFLFRALSTPKPWFWKSNSAGPRPRSCSRCCVMDSQAAVLWARHIKSLCNVVYVYISIHGYRYWYKYEYIYNIY